MITNTSKKLKESLFFFEKFKQCINTFNTDYEYYLSAFMSAARSITYLMEKECGNTPVFKEWWQPYDKKGYQKFNDLRVVMVHQDYPKMSHVIVHDFGKGLTLKGGESAECPVILSRPVGPSPVQVYISDSKGDTRQEIAVQMRDIIIDAYYEKEKREVKFESFVKEAEDYLHFLENIVKEFESKFIKSANPNPNPDRF